MTLVLLVFAFVLFVLGVLPYVEPYRLRIVSAGLACWIASMIFGNLIK